MAIVNQVQQVREFIGLGNFELKYFKIVKGLLVLKKLKCKRVFHYKKGFKTQNLKKMSSIYRALKSEQTNSKYLLKTTHHFNPKNNEPPLTSL